MFKIGEFSTIARVSGVLLRHYDQIDLFKPIYVSPENGYRYYTIEQLTDLNRILALRDLGFTLEQIGRLVHDNISSDEIQGMLILKQAQIEQSVAEEQARLRRIASRLKQVQLHGHFSQYDIVLKPLPEASYLSIREPVPYLAKAGQLYYEVGDAVSKYAPSVATYCMAIFHDPIFRNEGTDFELGYLLDKPQALEVPLANGRSLTVKQLDPIHQAVTCIHTGPWSEIHIGFSAIGYWLEANKLTINGNTRELYLNLVPPHEDEKLVVELQIPIKETL